MRHFEKQSGKHKVDRREGTRSLLSLSEKAQHQVTVGIKGASNKGALYPIRGDSC